MRQSLFLLSFALFVSCGPEEVGNSAPEGVIHTPTDILYFPGNTVFISAIFKDGQGLADVHVQCTGLTIDKHYALDGEPNYTLSYSHQLHQSLFPQVYTIEIVVTDVEGNKAYFEYPVDLARLPTVEGLNLYYTGKPGDVIPLQGTLVDEQGLFRYRLVCLGIEVDMAIYFEEDLKRYVLQESFEIQSYSLTGKYPLSIEVTNKRQLSYQSVGFVEVTK